MTPVNNINKLTAVIVDDEFHGRENLKKIIDEYCHEVTVLGMADSVVSGQDLIAQHKPDVVFLDINMPVLDGFDFLDEFEVRDFMVVFVTAYDNYGIKALKAGAVDYILKPVSIAELKITVKKLLTLKREQNDKAAFWEEGKLVIPSTHGFKVIFIKDIVRLEAEKSYTTIIMKEGKSVIVSRTLKHFEDSLHNEKFFRTHKSHLIHLIYVKEYTNIDGGFVIMEDGSKVEISRRRAPGFIQKIKEILNAI